MAGHSVERHTVYRREQLPVKKARYATGTERGYLVKDTLTGAVPEPGVTGEPSDAPQHQLARLDAGDAPPVDKRSRHHGRGPASSKAFAYEAPEDKAGHPPGRSAVPAEPPTDRPQIANDHVLETWWDCYINYDGVDAVDQAVLAREHRASHFLVLVVERGSKARARPPSA